MQPRFQRRLLRNAVHCCLTLSILICAAPQPSANSRQGSGISAETVVTIAIQMLGRPYKFRGEAPSGFDCSGLVRYSFLAAGVDLPHGAEDLRDATRHIDSMCVRRGDLVFFEHDGKDYGHVGIYIGNGRFIHAPRPGKTVRIDRLQDPYWQERFCDARRVDPGMQQSDPAGKNL